MQLHGGNILGNAVAKSGATNFRAVNPATAEPLEPAFHTATDKEAARAVELAEEVFSSYRNRRPDAIADFLDSISAGLEHLGSELIDRARAETALPEARLLSERGRTTAQLRMFAALVREGSWLDARIDLADAARKPIPKPDLRRMLVPLGPIVVFGASNFPLAFSVCGGDTASALAAGNPVVVKAHPAHPGTSELFAHAVLEALKELSLPLGVFAMLQGRSPQLSAALVKHPSTTAVGFTGSTRVGRILFDLAAARAVPIPVYAEMGSLNPLVVLPSALAEKSDAIAKGLAGSVLLGGGQFCTKPGLVFVVGDDDRKFVDALAKQITATTCVTMLNKS